MGSTGNREYTANWEANANNIVFNANGGKGEMTAQSIKTDETAPLFPNSFARDGYRFAGWATSADGEVEYSDGANYTMGAESEYTLYAVWKAVNYSISYELNGGVAEGNPDFYTIESQSFTLNAPVRAGYTFAGWTGTDIESATQFVTVTQGSWGDREYTAVWMANQNKIIFNVNGGEGKMPEQMISTDSSAPLTENVFTRAGYTFAGWATSPEGDVVYADCSDYLMGTESQYNLYAVWSPNLNNIIFDGNGADGGEMGDVSAHTNEVIMLPENTFERTGHTFVGWATEPGGGVIYEDEAEYTMGAAASYTLYAVWQINQYTITIESNGGTKIAPITQDYGTVVQAPVVTRSGYTFVEWYADSDLTEVFNFATMPAENVTAYAKWQMSNLGGELTGIRTADELMSISGNLAGNYYLENDINMSGYEWIPVGTEDEPFTGSFDGKNFTIKSLRITNCNLSYAGFFGYSDGEIKNIYISGSYSGKFSNVGGIAGYGTVTNCHWSGYISTNASGTSGRIGGIVGEGSAYQCSASGSIASVYVVDYCGGIVGYGNCIENCYSNLTINGNSTATNSAPAFGGLIAGRAESVENCLVGESAAYHYKKYNGWNVIGYSIYRISGSGSIQHSFSYTDDAEKLQSRDYMVNTAGWDESIWCFGYGLPVFYGTEYIRVIYENCEGVNNDENPSAYQVGSDGFTLAVPYRTGYTFNGWYLDVNFENEITEITSLSEPLTIYAKWTPNSYTITLNPVGGDLETDSVQVDYDGEYQLSVPTLFGYKFVGWYDGTGQTAVAYTDEEGRSLAPWTDTRGLTLYAKWQQIRFTLSLEYEGADANFDTESLEVWTGEEYTLPVPSRENYVFGGWYSAPGGGGTKYADEEGNGIGVWSYDGDITLYAYWLGTDGLAYTLNEGGTYTLTGLTDTSLTEIYIPEYFDGKPVTEIAENAFASGSDITEIIVPASISAIGKGAFAGCTALQSLAVPFIGNARGAEGEAALLGWLFSDTPMSGCTLVYQYYSEYGMSAAYIPDSLTEVTVTDAENIGYGAFSSVTSLQSVSITANALGERAFYDCASLVEAELCSGITAIGQSAFARCVALQEIAIPSSVQTVGRYVFDECAALTSLTLPFIGANASASGAEGALGYLFGAVSSADMVLVNQSSVTAYFPVRLANLTITNATQIAANALRGLTMLKSIAWNDGITSIGDYALYGCTGVTSLALPASLQTVGNYAFYNVKISVLELPQSVVSLGTYALYGSGLRTLLVPSSSVVSLGDRALDSTHTALKIYVTDSLLSSYKSSWSAYSSRIYSFNCIRENGMAIDGGTFLQYFGDETEIALPANITEIGAYAFAGTNVRSILVPGNVRTIGSYAFSGCDTLETVRMLSGVRAISANAFYGATGLTDIEVPNTVTEIGANAFYDCASLQEIVVPNSVTSIGEGAFRGCNSLVKMMLPFVGGSRSTTTSTPTTASYSSWDGGSQYLFGYIFGGELVNITSSSSSSNSRPTSTEELIYQGENRYQRWDGSRYNNYYNRYYIPSSLREIMITDATGISANAFYGCTMLTSITLNDGMTAIYDRAFYNCDGLTEMVIPESVTSIGNSIFSGCDNLAKVTLPSGLTEVANYTFQNCTALTSVNGDGEVVIGTKVTSVGDYAFNGCTSISKVTLPAGLETIGSYAFNNAASLVQINIPISVTSIGSSAFSGCVNLVRINSEADGKIILQEGLTSIGISAFQNLGKITEVVVPNSVTSIGAGAFQGCNSLVKMALPFVGESRSTTSSTPTTSSSSWSGGSRYLFGYIFGGELVNITSSSSSSNSRPTSTEELIYQGENRYQRWGGSRYNNYYNRYYIPSSLREIVITDAMGISANAFYGCTMLTSITLNEGITAIYTYAFYNCDGLTEMVIPESVASIGTYGFAESGNLAKVTLPSGLTEISNYMFQSCPLLASVNGNSEVIIGANVTSIGTSAFYGCASISKVTLPNGLVEIGSSAFSGATSLTQINIPASVAEIGASAFADCANLVRINSDTDGKVILQEGLAEIGGSAFRNLGKITEVVVPNSVTGIGAGAFQGCNSLVKMMLPFVGGSRSTTTSTPTTASYSSWDGGSQYLFGYIFGGELVNITSSSSSSNSRPTSTEELIYQGENRYQRWDGSRYNNYYNRYYIPSSLREIVITDATGISANAFYGCTMLTSITLNEGITAISTYAFYNCDGLTEMVIPESVTSIGSYAFSECSQLQIVQVLREDVLSLTSLGSSAFDLTPATLLILVPDDAYSAYVAAANWSVYANKIRPISAAQDGFIVEDGVLLHYIGTAETVTIPAGITSIGEYAFAFNRYVKTVVIGDAVVSVGNYAFYNCTSLQNVTIGNGVQTIGSYAFYGCAALQSVTYGDGLQSIGDYAFAGCVSLGMVNSESANMAVLGKNLATIGQYAFQNCVSLKAVTVENLVINIGVGAFMGCNSLNSIVLPFVGADGTATAGYMQVFGYIFGYTTSNTAGTVEQVSGYYYYIPALLTNVVITQETSLAENAFTGCANITSIELSAVQSIADYAFYGCDGLVSLTIRVQTMPALSATAFNGGKTVTVYVLAELVGQYQADGQWNKHSILAIS